MKSSRFTEYSGNHAKKGHDSCGSVISDSTKWRTREVLQPPCKSLQTLLQAEHGAPWRGSSCSSAGGPTMEARSAIKGGNRATMQFFRSGSSAALCKSLRAEPLDQGVNHRSSISRKSVGARATPGRSWWRAEGSSQEGGDRGAAARSGSC